MKRETAILLLFPTIYAEHYSLYIKCKRLFAKLAYISGGTVTVPCKRGNGKFDGVWIAGMNIVLQSHITASFQVALLLGQNIIFREHKQPHLTIIIQRQRALSKKFKALWHNFIRDYCFKTSAIVGSGAR